MEWKAGDHATKTHDGAPALHHSMSLLGSMFAVNAHRKGTEKYVVICDGATADKKLLCVYPSKQVYEDALVNSCVYGKRAISVHAIELSSTTRLGAIKADDHADQMWYFELKGVDSGLEPVCEKFASKNEAELSNLHHAINGTLKKTERKTGKWGLSALTKKAQSWTSAKTESKSFMDDAVSEEEEGMSLFDNGGFSGGSGGGTFSPGTYRAV